MSTTLVSRRITGNMAGNVLLAEIDFLSSQKGLNGEEISKEIFSITDPNLINPTLEKYFGEELKFIE